MANGYSDYGAGGAPPGDMLDPTSFGAATAGPASTLDDARALPFETWTNRFEPEPMAPLPPAAPMAPAGVAPRALAMARAREAGGAFPTPPLPAEYQPDVTDYAGPAYEERLRQGFDEYQASGGRTGIAPSTFEKAMAQQAQFKARNPDLAFISDVAAGKAQTERTTGQAQVGQELIGSELEKRQADLERQRQDYARQEFDAAKARAREQQQYLQQAEAELSALDKEVRETKIDPNAYWTNQNAFGKALSALSVALGAFAQGFSGGKVPNAALQMMNAAIERELDAQKSNLANKRASLGEKKSIYAMARQRFGDAQAAEDYTRARLYDAIGAQAQAFKSEARSDQLVLGAEKIAAESRQRVDDLQNNVRQGYVSREMERRAAEQRRQEQAAAYRAGAEERMLKRAKTLGELEEQQARIGKMKVEASGFGADKYSVVGVQEQTPQGKALARYAVPKEFAKDAADAIANSTAFESSVEAALEASKETGFRAPGSAAGRRFDVAIGQARGALAKQLAGGYNPTSVHEERAAELLPDKPWLLPTGAWESSMKSAVGLGQEQMRRRLEAYQAQPLEGAPPSGAPVKTYSTAR